MGTRLMTSSRWYHGVNLLLGIGLLLFPSLLELDGTAQAITYGTGAIVVSTAVWAFVQPRAQAPMWITLFVGAGYFFTPGVVDGGTGFPPRAAAAVWTTSLLILACVRVGLKRIRLESPPDAHARQGFRRPEAPDPKPIGVPMPSSESEPPPLPRSVESIH